MGTHVTKNVALAPAALSESSILAVYMYGPSSKVTAIVPGTVQE